MRRCELSRELTAVALACVIARPERISKHPSAWECFPPPQPSKPDPATIPIPNPHHRISPLGTCSPTRLPWGSRTAIHCPACPTRTPSAAAAPPAFHYHADEDLRHTPKPDTPPGTPCGPRCRLRHAQFRPEGSCSTPSVEESRRFAHHSNAQQSRLAAFRRSGQSCKLSHPAAAYGHAPPPVQPQTQRRNAPRELAHDVRTLLSAPSLSSALGFAAVQQQQNPKALNSHQKPHPITFKQVPYTEIGCGGQVGGEPPGNRGRPSSAW